MPDPERKASPYIRPCREKLGRSVKGYFERIPDPADHPVLRIEPIEGTPA